jgi:hypothetical protein
MLSKNSLTGTSLVDRIGKVQAPTVSRYVRGLRLAHPDESPAQIIERLERRFMVTVTGSGSAVGAAAAFPGVGTVTSLVAIGGEAAFFLEASTLLTLAIAEIHGIHTDDSERRATLVMAVALGDEGALALAKALGSKRGSMNAIANGALPTPVLRTLNKQLTQRLMKRYAKAAPMAVGKLLPAGIGAAIGGVGNRALGKKIIANSRDAFGPPPAQWPTPSRTLPKAARSLPSPTRKLGRATVDD